MIIRVREGVTPKHLTAEALKEIAASLVIHTGALGVRPVFFGRTQPADTSVPWQPTDELGNSSGYIRFYRAGGWQ